MVDMQAKTALGIAGRAVRLVRHEVLEAFPKEWDYAESSFGDAAGFKRGEEIAVIAYPPWPSDPKHPIRQADNENGWEFEPDHDGTMYAVFAIYRAV